MRLGIMAATGALAALAACDGTDDIFDELSPAETFEERIDDNADLVDRVEDLPVATAAEMPISGAATYDGYANVVIDTSTVTALLGEASLEADFGDGTIDGALGDFVGTVDGSPVRDFDGTLVLSDGEIGLATASGFGAEVGGLLDDGTNDIEVDGSIAGSFRSDAGADASALTALTVGGTDFLINDEERGGLMTITAER